MKKTKVSAKSVNSNYELELRNSVAYNKRLMAYAQARANIGKRKTEKK